MSIRGTRRMLLALFLALFSIPLFAQQTGSISGRVTATDGSALPGVTVEARSSVLPQPRTTVTDGSGQYRLPALVPGTYTLTYSLAGLETGTRKAEVLLGQTITADVSLGMAGVAESITVTAEATLVDPTSTEIKSGLSNEQIESLPVGQEYRDLVKLIPGVQVSQDETRGPSAGGSGQDNVYQFDGVNVTLPLYGTLAGEASSHDIAQINTIKGGARAVDFDRSGGFTIDSVSKSGTNEFSGQVSYQAQTSGMTSAIKNGSNLKYEQDRTWSTLSLGGPVLRDRLYFYGSYYRPTKSRDNQSNLYGDLPSYSSERSEGFGKLTFTPISSMLWNVSYRRSTTDEEASDIFAQTYNGTVASGNDSSLNIGILEGSWVINNQSYATVKLTDFANETASVPDFLSNATLSLAPGTHLDIANLAEQGRLDVPLANTGNANADAFRRAIIDKYGYLDNGVRAGGGRTGFGSEIDNDDFFRRSGQIGYNLTLGSNISHDLHVGYQRYEDAEELERTSNGWGVITVPGGSANCPNAAGCGGQPVFYQATFLQAGLGGNVVRKLRGEYHSQNIELNDVIRMNNWSFNAGLLVSQDTLYGQGLKEDSSTLSGYVSAPGHRYKMYQVDWDKMIQPRFGATWAYNGSDTVYASFARYNPAASSLPRAASWDRNFITRTLRAYFDASGNLMGVDSVRSSSGKLFQDDMDPRQVLEYMIGTSQQLTPGWSARAYGRYRHADHFWEDTNNSARIDYAHGADVPPELYIPDLDAKRGQIGSGSSYVIAELDGAFTRYYEATLESDWHGGNTFLRGSYTWSHYYGNFDQDNTTTTNDQNIFIGSSFLSDGPGRQLWDNKYGDLRGDRRHLLKVYGSYQLAWHASAGAFASYQSGQPWEVWDWRTYKDLPDIDEDDTNRYAEPAGSRRSSPHYQLDLNYTQNIPAGPVNLQLIADVFNVFDKQTGYNIQPKANEADFGKPRLFFEPRRFQLTARVQF